MKGVAGLPKELYDGLNSSDPEKQGKALVDALALGYGVAQVTRSIAAQTVRAGVNVATKETTSTLGTADALFPDAEFAGRGVVRSDLTDHLINPDVLKKQISGGHNSDNFMSALNNAGGTVTSKVEIAPGIYQLEYQLPGAAKAYPKTVYDPNLYSDATMADMANMAANKGLIQYQLTGNTLQKVVVNGVEFTVPVRVQNGQPYVPTAYPVGVKK